MTPDEVERLFAGLAPPPFPGRVRGAVLARARQRARERRDLARLAILAAAAALMWTLTLGILGLPSTPTDPTPALRAMSSVPSFPGLPPALRQQVWDRTAFPSSAAQPPLLSLGQGQAPGRFPFSRYEP